MSHLHHSGLQSWHIALGIALIFPVAAYLRSWIVVRNLDRNSASAWKALGFLVGVLLIWLAMGSPIATFDHQMLTAHMVQHLVLMTLAPPLIWLANPREMLLRGLPLRLIEAGSRLFRSQLISRIGRAITRPAVCWLLGAGALIAWHVPSVFALGMRSETLHGMEQISFLVAGFLFWWPVVRPWPSRSHARDWTILLYLFLATLPCDILSGFLVFCDRVVYPAYGSSQLHGLSPLEDQQCAGALMWTVVTIVYLVAGTIYAARLLSPATYKALPQEQPCVVEIV